MTKITKKSKISTITLILVLTFSAMLFALPTTIAQEAPYSKKTLAVIEVVPNPVGVDQTALIAAGITDPVARPQTGWENITVTIEKPNGDMETIENIKTDFNGLTGILYTPDQVGTYRFQTHFPEQISISSTRGYPPGTVMEASVSEIFELVVQEEQLPDYPGVPLPTEYWSRPIDAQARGWYTIGGNWLNIESISRQARPAPYNDYAPETAHVLWAKPLLKGGGGALGDGLAGGANQEHAFEDGDAYEGHFGSSVIIAGVLYINRFREVFGSRYAHEVVAVDLRTGEELWAKPLIDSDGDEHSLSFGQTYYWDGYNIHGVYSYLWATQGRTWHAFEASSGRWIYSMTNVPSGDNIEGPNGNIIRYTVDLEEGWMTKWSTENVVTTLHENIGGFFPGSWNWGVEGSTLDAGLGIEWNTTIPAGLPGASLLTLEDRVIGSNFESGSPAPETLRMWAISGEEGQEGTLLFNVTWPRPFRDVYMHIGYGDNYIMSASVEDGVFIVSVADTRQHFGIDINTGEILWGPTESQPINDRFAFNSPDFIYNGIYYSGFMSGVLHAYNVTTGDLLWTYENVDPYVFTERWQRELGANYFSMHTAFGADGKLYVPDSEHSPNDPKSRGAPFTCFNATTGEVIWKVSGMFKGTRWGGHAIIGDSIIATMDTYDGRIYAIGRGPTATTVSSPDTGVPLGSSLMIRGTVMDISAGTTQQEIAARFPNGVPAVADESMSDWMLYVYKQFPRPADVSGVDVLLSIRDPNNNYHDMTVTTDASGTYNLMWEPPVPGMYTVLAIFLGTEGYWPSQAQTAFGVDEAPSAGGPIEPEPIPSPTPSPSVSPSPSRSPSPSESPSPSPSAAAPLITTEVAIIAAVAVAAVIGIAAYWVLRKRR